MLIRENPRKSANRPFSPGDAISNEAINIQRVLGGEIYGRPPASHNICQPITGFEPKKFDVLIYHCSIGTRMADCADRCAESGQNAASRLSSGEVHPERR